MQCIICKKDRKSEKHTAVFCHKCYASKWVIPKKDIIDIYGPISKETLGTFKKVTNRELFKCVGDCNCGIYPINDSPKFSIFEVHEYFRSVTNELPDNNPVKKKFKNRDDYMKDKMEFDDKVRDRKKLIKDYLASLLVKIGKDLSIRKKNLAIKTTIDMYASNTNINEFDAAYAICCMIPGHLEKRTKTRRLLYNPNIINSLEFIIEKDDVHIFEAICQFEDHYNILTEFTTKYGRIIYGFVNETLDILDALKQIVEICGYIMVKLY